MLNNIKIKLQYLLPKQLISQQAGWCAGRQAGWLTQLMIKAFARYYDVNMKEAQNPQFSSYRTFNEFFIRPLRSGARPVCCEADALTCPADGTISQLGAIRQGELIQAKQHNYSLEALLAGNYQLAKEFQDGLFTAIYLAPQDYHRVHMPCKAVLREMIYVPGDLFSVNPLTTASVPNLFARNERVICIFDSVYGPMAQILVGATIVGSIETVWAGTVSPPREGIIRRWTYPTAGEEGAVCLDKGEEMGRFKLGSTVINLFAPGKINFGARLNSGAVTRVGEILATAISLSSAMPSQPERR